MLILCVKGPGYVSSLKFKSKSEHMVLCIVFFFFSDNSEVYWAT